MGSRGSADVRRRSWRLGAAPTARWLAVLTSCVLAGCAGVTREPSPADVTPPADVVAPTESAVPPDGLIPAESGSATEPGWGAPLFVETFDSDVLDPRLWFVYDYPDEVQFPRSREAAFVEDGALRLVGGYDGQGRDVSGGVASTINLMHGRWEARIRADEGIGYSPVVLLWPGTQLWPDDGEIDIVEVPDGSRQAAVMTLHNGPDDSKAEQSVTADFTQWHTVAVEWLPDRVSYYLDGQHIWTVNPPVNPDDVNLIPSTSPMHLALQNDKGCAPTSIPCRDDSTPPQVTMYIDEVRVWSLSTSAQSTG